MPGSIRITRWQSLIVADHIHQHSQEHQHDHHPGFPVLVGPLLFFVLLVVVIVFVMLMAHGILWARMCGGLENKKTLASGSVHVDRFGHSFDHFPAPHHLVGRAVQYDQTASVAELAFIEGEAVFGESQV